MQCSVRSLAARLAATTLSVALSLGATRHAWASDHFDSATMVANPQADIADVYAWTTPDGRLNLVMTIVGHSFSDRISYQFHVDSGNAFGHTTASTLIVCRFPGRDQFRRMNLINNLQRHWLTKSGLLSQSRIEDPDLYGSDDILSEANYYQLRFIGLAVAVHNRCVEFRL